MKFTPSKLNVFLFFKLPSAFWSGVRVKEITENYCTTSVKHKWFTQNPFKSMYFAIQAMAAELATGALVMYHIKKSNANISMLVARNKAQFTKKATGKITFLCEEGEVIKNIIKKAIDTKEGQVIWVTAKGTNQYNEQVAVMEFEWTIKVRN